MLRASLEALAALDIWLGPDTKTDSPIFHTVLNTFYNLGALVHISDVDISVGKWVHQCPV